MAMTEEELMAMYAATLFPEMLSTSGGDAGIGRTTQTQLLNPDLIASLGLFTPEQISSGVSQRLTTAEQQAYQDWIDEGIKLQAQKDSIREPVFINEIKNRYESNPTIWGILGGLFDGIEKGSTSANQVIGGLDSPRPVGEWVSDYGMDQDYADVVANQVGADAFSVNDLLSTAGLSKEELTRIQDDMKAFEQDASAFRSQKLQWNSTSAGKLEEINNEIALHQSRGPNIVDLEKERLQYFKDIGVPGLALLPDPSELPQVSISDVRKRRQTGTDKTLAESQLLANLAPASGKRDLQMQALRDMVGGPGPLPNAISSRVAVPRPSGMPSLEGDPYGRAVDAPGFGRAPSAMMPQVPLTDTPIRPAGGYRAPSEERDLAKYLQWEQQFYEGEKQREARRRASQGDTPFMNALRALQLYGSKVG